jgi:hypothetical protein
MWNWIYVIGHVWEHWIYPFCILLTKFLITCMYLFFTKRVIFVFYCFVLILRFFWKQKDSIIYSPGYEVSQLNSSFQILGAQRNDLFYALRSICHGLADTPEYTFWKDTWHKNHVFFCLFRCALCFSYQETIQAKDPPPTRVDLEEV